MDEVQADFSIYCGDWNLVLDQDMDTYNYLHINNPDARNSVLSFMERESMCDIWRELNPEAKTFSWRKKNPIKFARLDFFLISSHLVPYITNTFIEPGFQSDHSIIGIEIDFSRVKLGRGFFKFNNSLLQDVDYVKLVKETIKKVTNQYSVGEYTEELWATLTLPDIDNIPVELDSQLFFEVLLMEIRGATIQFSARKKRLKNAAKNDLLNKLERKENEHFNDPDNNQLSNEIEGTREELKEIYKVESEGVAIRSRAKYKLEGEKSTRSFCNLEKMNGAQKFISRLKILQGDLEIEINTQDEIEKEILRFYRDLYSNKDSFGIDCSIVEFLGPTANSIPKLTDAQKMTMEGAITQEEIAKYLKQLRNNKSPGSSGFTGEFYKFFWIDFKTRLTKAINYCFELGSLPASQTIGVLTLIPKGKKEKMFLKNWRPLTMLNTFYKIISGVITERLKPNLDAIISNNQKAYLPNRFIGEATRTTFDTLHAAKENNLPGVLLLIDFEKCFDSVSHKFVKKCLDFFNFGEDIKKWIALLIDNFSTCINHVGNISARFLLKRGLKQGDPISGFLFILCAEVLAHKIKYSMDIRGFQLGNAANPLEQYADDLKIFLKAFPNQIDTENNIRNTITVLNEFYNISGLKANIDKTHAIWFGSECDSIVELCPDLCLKWSTNFEALGIKYDSSLLNMNVNLTDALEKIRTTLNIWKSRFLSPYGKITVIKTLVFPKLTHLMLVLPNPCLKIINNLEKLVYEFLWDSKPNQVAKKYAILPEKKGGLNMISISEFWRALKVSWFRRLTFSKSFWVKILESQLRVNLNEIFTKGDANIYNLSKTITNPFWKETFLAGADLIKASFFSHPTNFVLSPIIENSLLKIGNQNITSLYLGGRGDMQIADLLNEHSTAFLTYIEFNHKYQLNIPYLRYEGIKNCVLGAARKLNYNIHVSVLHPPPRQTLFHALLLMQEKGCRHIYNIFLAKTHLSTNTSEIEQKWHNDLGSIYSIDRWNSYWVLYSKIKLFNEIKFLQYRILHHSLKTSRIAAKFLPNVSPNCAFCHILVEDVTHLFFSCNIVKNFWNEIKYFFQESNVELNISKSCILFGDLDFCADQPNNLALLFGKMFIWKSKYVKNIPTIAGFKNYLRFTLHTLKTVYFMCDKINEFVERWEIVYLSLEDRAEANGEGDEP